MLFKTGNVEDLKAKLHNILHADTEIIKQQEYRYYVEHYRDEAIKNQLTDIYGRITRLQNCSLTTYSWYNHLLKDRLI